MAAVCTLPGCRRQVTGSLADRWGQNAEWVCASRLPGLSWGFCPTTLLSTVSWANYLTEARLVCGLPQWTRLWGMLPTGSLRLWNHVRVVPWVPSRPAGDSGPTCGLPVGRRVWERWRHGEQHSEWVAWVTQGSLCVYKHTVTF